MGVEIRTSPEIMLTSFQGDKKVGNNYWRVGNMTENSTLTFQLEHKDNNTEAEVSFLLVRLFTFSSRLPSRTQIILESSFRESPPSGASLSKLPRI